MRSKPPRKQDDEEIDPDAFQISPNRQELRRQGRRNRQAMASGVHKQLQLGPSGQKRGTTGQPDWFKRMRYEKARSDALKRVHILNLRAAVGDIVDQLEMAGYRRLYDVVSETDINTLLGHGIKIGDLRKLSAYLQRNDISVSWQ